MRTAAEKRAAATAATRKWRATHPAKPLTPAQREKRRASHRRWREANPDKRPKYDPTTRARLPWARMLGVRQAHAKKRGVPFTLRSADAKAVWTGACALTGLAFDMRENTGIKGPRPFSPSLDRINPAAGYVPGNVRFVLHCVNAFRGTMTDAQMRAVAAKIVDMLH